MLPHCACQQSPSVCSSNAPKSTPQVPARRMSGFGCPSCIDTAFLPGSFCQQNSEALPEAGVVPQEVGAQSQLSDMAPPWLQGWQSSLPMGTVLPALPAQGCLADPGLLRDTEEGHHSLLVALSSQEDQGGCQGSLCQFCWHRDQRKLKRKSEKSTQPAAL